MAETGRGKEDRAPEKEGNLIRFGPRVRAKNYQMVASQEEMADWTLKKEMTMVSK